MIATRQAADTAAGALVRALSALQLVYVHLVNHELMGAPAVPNSCIAQLRAVCNGTFIVSGGLDRAKAETLLASGAVGYLDDPTLASAETSSAS